jgi:hypothetical protein
MKYFLYFLFFMSCEQSSQNQSNENSSDAITKTCLPNFVSGNCVETLSQTSPAMPVIIGEKSSGHNDLYWSWNKPTNTSHFQVQVNQGAVQRITNQFIRLENAVLGVHTVKVKACFQDNTCSDFQSFQSVYEHFGVNNSPSWKGVARQNLTKTALGNQVPLSCHNCYASSLASTITKIHTNIDRQADLIELDIVDENDKLCVIHDDLENCSTRGTLSQVLSDTKFKNHDSMLFIEIKERDKSPESFAIQFLNVLNANRDFIKNGRPVFVRIFYNAISYLKAIQNAKKDYPLIQNYLRFSVLYTPRDDLSVAAFQNKINNEVKLNNFHFAEFNFLTRNLLSLFKFTQNLNLGVGLYTLPATHGAKVHIASMREEVNQITTDYHLSSARIVAEQKNTMAYVNSSNCSSSSDSTVSVKKNLRIGVTSTEVDLNKQSQADQFGFPPLLYDSAGEDRFGCSLDFRKLNGVTQRALNIGHHQPQEKGGFLVSTYVNFDRLDSFPEGTMAIVNSSENGGFVLELITFESKNYIRFGVHINGAYRYHQYNIFDTGLGGIDQVLNGRDGYFLVGAYDGRGGIYLWINNKLVGSGGTWSGGVTPSSQPTLIGADPQFSSPTKARFYFDGIIQQVSVQRWHE